MGRRAGLILAALGLLLALVSAYLYGVALSATISLITNPSPSLLAPLAVGITLFLGLISLAVSSFLYLAAYFTSRALRSKAVGALFIVGGLVVLSTSFALSALLLPRYSGPAGEFALAAGLFIILPIVISILFIIGGVRTARRVV